MIQDLNINSPYLWKFVDDTTASEILPKGNVSTAQNIADHIKQWSEENRLKLHPDKCKELRISFSKDPVVLDQVILNGKEVEIVESAKLLGVIISNNLTWHAHIKEVVKKASKRLYYLVQLKRARLPVKDLVLFYTLLSLPSTIFKERIDSTGKKGYFNNKSRNGLLCNRRNFEHQTNRRTP